eukprot:4384776-Pyramimonas_sp.AAC.1
MDWCEDRGPQLFDLKRPDGRGVQPHVICNQETRLKTDEKLQQAYQRGLQLQFDLSPGKASSTGEGANMSSAGVALGVVPSIAPSVVETELVEGLSSRIAARLLNVGPPSGPVVITVYSYTSLGLKGGNLVLLDVLGQYVRKIQCLWLIQAYWHFTPNELAASGWLERAGGSTFTPGQPTCRFVAAEGGDA